jgi:hypothetical protein
MAELGVGDKVSAPIASFGREWAKENFPQEWQTKRLFGVIRAEPQDFQDLAPQWLVAWSDGDESLHLRSQLTLQESQCLTKIANHELNSTGRLTHKNPESLSREN